MRALLLLLLSPFALAQAPVNSTLIWPEGITIVSTTGTAVVFEFGTGTKFNTIPALKLPALISCANSPSAACTALGGDPVPNVAKNIYAVQQKAAYTVAIKSAAGVASTVTVPALPVVPPVVVGPSTTATVPPPTSASRIFWCDITMPTFNCIPARTDGK